MHGRYLFKILGLSMLVAVSAMAVSASAAQAKWLLLVDEKSVLLANFFGIYGGGLLKVESIGLEIECTGGAWSAHLQLDSAHKTLTGSGTAKFTGCDVVGFEEFCEVYSAGQPDGTIVASGSGIGKMYGEKTFGKLSSEEFTKIFLTDPLEICPVSNMDFRLNGVVTLTLDEPTEDNKLHTVKLDDQELFHGNAPVTLEGEGGGSVLGSVEEESGGSWALHLVGL